MTAALLALCTVCSLLFTGCGKKPDRFYQFTATDAVSCTVQHSKTGKGFTFDSSSSAKEFQTIILAMAEGSFARGSQAASAGAFLYVLKFYSASGNLIDTVQVQSENEIVHEGYVYTSEGGCLNLIDALNELFDVVS